MAIKEVAPPDIVGTWRQELAVFEARELCPPSPQENFSSRGLGVRRKMSDGRRGQPGRWAGIVGGWEGIAGGEEGTAGGRRGHGRAGRDGGRASWSGREERTATGRPESCEVAA